MPITERLALIITANPQDAVRGFQNLERAADKSLRTTEDKMDRLGQRFTKVGAIALTGGALAAAGLYKAGQAASDLEQQVGATEAVFGAAIGTIDDFAKGSARSVGLSEREFRRLAAVSGAMLKNLGANASQAADESLQLVKVGADLAAQYGGTTTQAVEALGAALRGEADPAERFGLRLTASAVAAEAVALGLAASASAVDDNARRQATLSLILEQSTDAQGAFNREQDTAAGRMQTAEAALDDLVTNLGAAALPVISDAAGFVGGLAEKFNELPDGVQGAISTTAVATTGLLLFGGAAATVIGQIIKMRDTFKSLPPSVQGFAGTVGRLGAAAGVLAVLGTAVSTLGSQFHSLDRANLGTLSNNLLDFAESGRVAGDFAELFGEDLHKLGQAVERIAAPSVATRIDNVAASIADVVSLGNAPPDHLDQARARLTDLDAALAQLAGQSPEAAAQAMQRLTDHFEAQGVPAERLANLLPEYEGVLANLNTTSRTAAAGMDRVTGEAVEQDDSFGRLTATLAEYLDALTATFDPLFGLTDALDNHTQAQAAAEEALRTYGAESAEYRQANLDAAQSALGVEGAVQRLSDGVRNGNVQLDEARSTLRRWVDQGILTQQQAANISYAFDEVIGRADALDGRNVNLLVTATFKGLSSSEIARLTSLEPGGRAIGGPVAKNTPYIVGERGPELFVPDASGSILPHDQLAGLAGGAPLGAGQVVMNITIAGRATYDDGQEVVDALVRWSKSNGTVPEILWRN